MAASSSGTSALTTTTSPSKSAGSASTACSTARPVPGTSSWSTMTAPGVRLDDARRRGRARAARRRRGARARARRRSSSTCWISGRPAERGAAPWRRGLHARALACGEDDDGEAAFGHGAPRGGGVRAISGDPPTASQEARVGLACPVRQGGSDERRPVEGETSAAGGAHDGGGAADRDGVLEQGDDEVGQPGLLDEGLAAEVAARSCRRRRPRRRPARPARRGRRGGRWCPSRSRRRHRRRRDRRSRRPRCGWASRAACRRRARPRPAATNTARPIDERNTAHSCQLPVRVRLSRLRARRRERRGRAGAGEDAEQGGTGERGERGGRHGRRLPRAAAAGPDRTPGPAPPAALRSSARRLRHQDSNLDLTAPKAVVLPLHHGGPRSRAGRFCQTRRACRGRCPGRGRVAATRPRHGCPLGRRRARGDGRRGAMMRR